MDIGDKIRQARKNAGMTQEQAAEAIGVSRQTISNWENNKSYPDIISVITMSDLYAVSLDALLKGENPMNDYYNYLDESTNTVRSNTRKGKLILIAVYLVIWALGLIEYWFFLDSADALGYSLLFFFLVLPVVTFVLSVAAGFHDYWGKLKWFFVPLALGVMYMLAEYGTFTLENAVVWSQGLYTPEWPMILNGAVVSLVGLGIGSAVRTLKKRRSSH